MTSTSAPATTAAIPFVARSAGGSFMPGRYLRFSPAPLMLSTVSASRAQSVIGALRDTTAATVVPQLPPPSSPTFNRIALSRHFGARATDAQVIGKQGALDLRGRLRILHTRAIRYERADVHAGAARPHVTPRPHT